MEIFCNNVKVFTVNFDHFEKTYFFIIISWIFFYNIIFLAFLQTVFMGHYTLVRYAVVNGANFVALHNILLSVS